MYLFMYICAMSSQRRYTKGFRSCGRVDLVAPIRDFKEFYIAIVRERHLFVKDKAVPVSYFMRWDMESIREYIDKKYIWTYTKKEKHGL